MKDFINTFKQTKKVTGDNVFIGVGFGALGAIIGVIIALVILFTEGTGEDYAHMGAFMVLMVVALTLVVDGFIVFPADFMQAIAMGKARKHLIPSHYLLWLWNTFAVLLMALTVSFLEDFAYSRLFTEAVCEIDVKGLLCNPLIFVTILLCVPAVILFMGGITLTVGNKAIWALAGILLMGSGFSTLTKQHPDMPIVKALNNLKVNSFEMSEVAPICLVCLLISAVLLTLAWMMLRKQRVTF
ncbi:MAG: hypothetical protein IKL22_07880 [Lachnospiraceae bacterium]|nr:hypothetical protein [Lachnospiraceae bacterium]